MTNQTFNQRIIEKIHAYEMESNRIGNRRYSSMVAAHELGNVGGTSGLRGELVYIRRLQTLTCPNQFECSWKKSCLYFIVL